MESSSESILIDLTNSDQENTPKTDDKKQIFFPPVAVCPLAGRDSLDNNPFDRMHKQVQYINDPFEILTKTEFSKIKKEEDISDVKMGSLIDLDRNLLGENDSSFLSVPRNRATSTGRFSSISSIGSGSFLQSPTSNDVFATNLSPIFNNSSICKNSQLDLGFITETSINSTVTQNSSEINSLLNKGFVNTDNTIPVFNSPNMNYALINHETLTAKRSPFLGTKFSSITKRDRIHSDSDLIKLNKDTKMKSSSLDISLKKNQLLKLSLSNLSSPHSSPRLRKDMENTVYIEATMLANKFARLAMNSSYQQNNDDSCDDIMSINPNWIDSDFESDIETTLQSPVVNDEPIVVPEIKVPEIPEIPEIQKEGVKIEEEKEEEEKPVVSENLNSMIEHLQEALESCDDQKKNDANNLLESLKELLVGGSSTTEKSQQLFVPTAIVRQGTFDIDSNTDESPPKITEEQKQTQNVNSVMEQLGKILGNENLNLLQNNTTNPTYIVVMNAPPQPLVKDSVSFNPNVIEYDSPTNFDNDFRPSVRSKSLSLPDKPASVIKAVQNKINLVNANTTPARPNGRRSSFSFSKPIEKPTATVSSTRRSMYSAAATSRITPRKIILPSSVAPPQIRNQTFQARPQHIILKKTRQRSSESINGPMKATIPIKRVAPMITRSVSSPSDDNDKKLLTSTPLINKPHKYPTACSTPVPVQQSKLTPRKEIPKSRMSYISATPNPKSRTSMINKTAGRRRSYSAYSDDVAEQTTGIRTPSKFKTGSINKNTPVKMVCFLLLLFVFYF